MLGRPLYSYYWFGTCLRFLQDCPVGISVGTAEDGRTLHNLNQFFSYLDDLNLVVTRRAASRLETFRDSLVSLGAEHMLTDEERKDVTEIVGQLRPTLEAEIQGLTAFMVTPKIIDVEKLLNDVALLLRPGTFEGLPAIARFDLVEAGRCIAFERPTAGAFHILRATEAVLRAFYEDLVRHKRIKSSTWGALIEDMRRRRKTQCHLELLNHLDHIRQSFRNPTQHPDKIYDIHEVQELWNLCIDAINRMAAVMTPPSMALPKPTPMSPPA